MLGKLTRVIRYNRDLRRGRNDFVFVDRDEKSRENRVNLNYWKGGGEGKANYGDMLSPVVVSFMLQRRGLTLDSPAQGVKHLYAIGSILFWGTWQDMTVWGSGFLKDPYPTRALRRRFRILHHLRHKVDVRCVRGPRTARVLRSLWIRCPAVYGDPALLLPRFYTPREQPARAYNLIGNHVNRAWALEQENAVDILTDDWRTTTDQICAARRNVSSSLHGIIVSEAYGIPAVLLRPEEENARPNTDLFKFDDYYHGTGRAQYPVARSVEEALAVEPPPLPNLAPLQEGLLRAFPYDLWKR